MGYEKGPEMRSDEQEDEDASGGKIADEEREWRKEEEWVGGYHKIVRKSTEWGLRKNRDPQNSPA